MFPLQMLYQPIAIAWPLWFTSGDWDSQWWLWHLGFRTYAGRNLEVLELHMIAATIIVDFDIGLAELEKSGVTLDFAL